MASLREQPGILLALMSCAIYVEPTADANMHSLLDVTVTLEKVTRNVMYN